MTTPATCAEAGACHEAHMAMDRLRELLGVSTLAEVEAEVAALKRDCDRLPRYADSNTRMLPGDQAWEVMHSRDGLTLGLGQIQMHNADEFLTDDEVNDIGPFYLTREAAEAALRAAKGEANP